MNLIKLYINDNDSANLFSLRYSHTGKHPADFVNKENYLTGRVESRNKLIFDRNILEILIKCILFFYK
jgi:hypothetical protein